MDSEPELEKHRNTIALRLAPAYQMLKHNLNMNDLTRINEITKVIPASPMALAAYTPPPSCDDRPNINKLAMRKIQGVLVFECAKAARLAFSLTNSHTSGYTDGRTEHDVNHTQCGTHRSQMSRIFMSSLFYYTNRLSAAAFVFHCRYILNLPALISICRDTGEQVGCTNEAKSFPVCAAGHNKIELIDPAANHPTACKQTYKTRYSLHERINRIIIQFAREAGAYTEREPPTPGILQDMCTPDQARTWFPKDSNANTRHRATILRGMYEKALNTDRGLPRKHLMNLVHAFAMATPGGTKGLRIDSRLLFGDEEFWIDGGATHTTQNGMIRKTTKWVNELMTANLASGGILRANSKLMEPSPCVSNAVAIKNSRYEPLLDIAAAQVKNGTRSIMPTFITAIVSHTGEMAPGVFTLVEAITRQYAKTITPTDLEDGISKTKRTGRFRSRFKDAIMTAMAEGFGRTLVSAGREFLPYIRKHKVIVGYQNLLTSEYTA